MNRHPLQPLCDRHWARQLQRLDQMKAIGGEVPERNRHNERREADGESAPLLEIAKATAISSSSANRSISVAVLVSRCCRVSKSGHDTDLP
jgi:hypothetical protein